jgi:hypothetical protein
MNDRHDDHPDSIRRRLLQAGAGAAALGAVPAAVRTATAQAPFDWKNSRARRSRCC